MKDKAALFSLNGILKVTADTQLESIVLWLATRTIRAIRRTLTRHRRRIALGERVHGHLHAADGNWRFGMCDRCAPHMRQMTIE